MSRVFRRVLCALDLGPSSKSCLNLASRLVNGEAQLILFHAVPRMVERLGQPIFVEPLTGNEHDAREALKTLAAAASLKHFEIAVVTGDPASEIVRTARELVCDLIVTATHGRVGVSHLLLGSVTERVVRESPVPVLTAPPDHDGHPIAASSVLI